ncbi:hypothetical protein WA026_014515 [Henosepilachna vigintioctopunctata]|uniref:C2H2-type domain-containing protein n=1 Tax=Henosepilachna vigintioctopunctata TaxID=420089 RepID=A0AAW1UKU1_9CUCU
MNFSTVSNITLSDSLSGYVTCDEDTENTRYLSLLSQDASFEGLNVTLCNSEADNDETQLVELTSEEDISQPLIFTIDGSNEIYGVQTACDEDGNLQKYQIQYMKDINGELTPMLETIQLLPSDHDLNTEIANSLISSDNMDVELHHCARDNVFVESKVESNCGFVDNINSHESEYIQNQNDASDGHIYRSEVISNSSISISNPNIKQESLELFDENAICSKSCNYSDSYISDEMKIPNDRNLNIEPNIPNTLVQIEMNDSNTEPEVQFEMDNSIENEQDQVLQDEEQVHVVEHFEQLFVQENHVVEDSQNMNIEDIMDNNDSDNETYHIVDGIHVTGDVESENPFDKSEESILKEAIEHHPKTNILKKSVVKCISKDQISSDQKIIYIQTLPEKENMEIFEIGSLSKPNSRSLLKCNQPKSLVVPDPLHVEMIGEGTHTITKRYSRTKEARQARQFINFLNSTTIPHVPERKERLPRKQQIKPVKHANEDIIVKEMIVSSNEFIEPCNAGEKKNLPVTEYVELLDSGDECSSVNEERKKKKSKRLIETVEIEISDSEESEIGVILNESDEDKSDGKSKTKNTKKKRGRPPKNKNLDYDKKDSDSNSETPPKISRTESDVDSVTSSLEVIRVENNTIMTTSDKNINNSSNKSECVSDCIDKGTTGNIMNSSTDNKVAHCNVNNSADNETAIISAINSSVHDEHTEKTDESVRNKSELKTTKVANNELGINKSSHSEVVQKKAFEYKHECEKCKTKFINKFLLNRHDCIVKSGLLISCDQCQKKFSSISTLNVHKKTHVKISQISKSNSLTKIPQISKEHGSVSSKSASNPSIKKSHGPSVKNPMRESIIPVRNSMRVRTSAKCPSAPLMLSSKTGQNNFLKPKDPIVVVTPDRTSKANTFKCEKQCDKCSEKFGNNAAWFDHQVLKHGLKTPDKKIGEKRPQKLVKSLVAHNGIRAGPALAKNFSLLRSKIQHPQ